MDIRQITPTYHVAPQIDPADMAALAEAGFTTVICNRPDAEVPASHQIAAMAEAAEAAGLAFHALPLTHQTFTSENVAAHRDLIGGAEGKVLAYCASGTRSTIAWALGQAGTLGSDEIVAAAQAAGYQLDNIRPTLDAIAASGQR
jgi:uncharacterized protein (TIGR01244 family)